MSNISNPDRDLWDDPKPTIPQEEAQWLPPNSVPQLTRAAKRKLQNPSALPAVEPPHPGQSYNPTFKDHQALLSNCLSIQETRAKKQRKIDRLVEECSKAVPADKEELDELAQLIFVKKEEKEEVDETESDPITLAVRPRMRTRQQRKNQKEENERLRIAKEKKLTAQRESEIYRIKNIKKSLEKKEKVQKEKLEKKSKQRIEREKYGQHTLSKYKYEDLDPAVVFSDELTGSFRSTAKNSQNLLVDRFKSLQKRNILEPRVKSRQKRKYKLKKFERKSRGDDGEKPVNYTNGKNQFVFK